MRNRLISAFFVLLLGGTVYAGSPMETASIFWGSPQGNAGDKTGLYKVPMEKVSMFTEYSPSLLKVGVASKITNFFWYGFEYSGNFLKWNMNRAETTNRPDIEALLTKKEFEYGVTDKPVNSFVFTGCMPYIIPGLPIGFHAGFSFEGDYERGLYDENFSGGIRESIPQKVANYKQGFKNGLSYVPNIGVASKSIPLPFGMLGPSIGAQVKITPNTKKAAFFTDDTTSSATRDVTATEQQYSFEPKVTLGVGLDFYQVSKTSHSVSVEYAFSGIFNGDRIKEVTDSKVTGSTANRTRIVEKQAQTQIHQISTSYTGQTALSDKLKVGWRAKVGFGVKNEVVPGAYDDYGITMVGLDTTTYTWSQTNKGGTKQRAAGNAVNAWLYKTTTTTFEFMPMLEGGLQYHITPDKVIFGCSVSITPFSYQLFYREKRVDQKLGTGGTSIEEQATLRNSFTSFSGSLNLGIGVYLTPKALLDSSLTLSANSNASNISIQNLLDGEFKVAFVLII